MYTNSLSLSEEWGDVFPDVPITISPTYSGPEKINDDNNNDFTLRTMINNTKCSNKFVWTRRVQLAASGSYS